VTRIGEGSVATLTNEIFNAQIVLCIWRRCHSIGPQSSRTEAGWWSLTRRWVASKLHIVVEDVFLEPACRLASNPRLASRQCSGVCCRAWVISPPSRNSMISMRNTCATTAPASWTWISPPARTTSLSSSCLRNWLVHRVKKSLHTPRDRRTPEWTISLQPVHRWECL